MKYYYLFLTIAPIITGVYYYNKDNDIGMSVCILTIMLLLGINDILAELRKNNSNVIIRDPKTGRF